MARDLTERQREILELIGRLLREQRVPPTVAELAAALAMAPPSMLQHLNALERKGYIARPPGRARSLHLLRSTVGDGRAM
jgi:repressor LexA